MGTMLFAQSTSNQIKHHLSPCLFFFFVFFLVQSFALSVSLDLSFSFIIQSKLLQYYLRYSTLARPIHPRLFYVYPVFFSPSSGPFNRQCFCSKKQFTRPHYYFWRRRSLHILQKKMHKTMSAQMHEHWARQDCTNVYGNSFFNKCGKSLLFKVKKW